MARTPKNPRRPPIEVGYPADFNSRWSRNNRRQPRGVILLCMIRRNAIPHPAQADSLAPARSASRAFGFAKFIPQLPKRLQPPFVEQRADSSVGRCPAPALALRE